MEIHPDVRHRFTIHSPKDHQEYRRMPSCVRNVAPTFHRILIDVLKGMLNTDTFVDLYYIMIIYNICIIIYNNNQKKVWIF